MDAAGDSEFRDFMLGRWPALVRLAYGLTGDRALAEDLAQTALARAYASWSRVRRTDNPDAYVRKIVLNANRSRFRARRVTEQLTSVPPDHGTSDETARQDDRSALMAALATLPSGQRAAVVLRYWLDLTEAQTAAALGCSVGNVKSQTSRALAKLRLSPELADGGLHEHR
jgi:RNA polymerase sigma-70 factor (sigma-E family)